MDVIRIHYPIIMSLLFGKVFCYCRAIRVIKNRIDNSVGITSSVALRLCIFAEGQLEYRGFFRVAVRNNGSSTIVDGSLVDEASQ